MKKKIFLLICLVLISIEMPNPVLSTTWCRSEFTCPICKTKNSFQTPMSSGSYIYDWPSKYDYVFWPWTTSEAVYMCKKCHLSCLMRDFASIPDAKLDAIRGILKDVRLEKEYEDYVKIPILEKLEVAEKVYRKIQKDDSFWCFFFRLKGYHSENQNQMERANAARKKALGFVGRMLGTPRYEGQKKEFLLIRGAMHHMLGESEPALLDMKEALTLSYQNKEMKTEDEQSQDQYLSKLLTEYIPIVERWHKIRALVEASASASSQEEKEKLVDELHREGLMLYDEKKYQDAIKAWLMEIEVAPGRVKPYNNIGITYRKLRDLDGALKYHMNAIQVNPNFGHSYYSLGLVYYDREDYEKVIELLRKAIELNYANADVYFTLGQALRLTEKYDQAVEAYQKVTELYFWFPGVHYLLGETYRLQKKYDEAIFELKKEISLDTEWEKGCQISLLEIETALDAQKIESFFILGQKYKELGGNKFYEKAVRAFRRTLDLNPSYPDAHYQLGQIYEEMAKQEYEKEIEAHPDHIDAKKALRKLNTAIPEENSSKSE